MGYVLGIGSNRISIAARIDPRNNEPASPIYILAGLLFHQRKPIVAPEITIEIPASKCCFDEYAKMLRINEEIATDPEAPPSMLSKKLMELLSPTIKVIVIMMSRILNPVGAPIVSDWIRIKATTIPTKD